MRHSLSKRSISTGNSPSTTLFVLIIAISVAITGFAFYVSPVFAVPAALITGIPAYLMIKNAIAYRKAWRIYAGDQSIEVTDDAIIEHSMDGVLTIPRHSVVRIDTEGDKAMVVLRSGRVIDIDGYDDMGTLLDELRRFEQRNTA